MDRIEVWLFGKLWLYLVVREQEAPIALQPYFSLAFAECRERPLDLTLTLTYFFSIIWLCPHVSVAGVRLNTNQQLPLKSSNPFILKTLRKPSGIVARSWGGGGSWLEPTMNAETRVKFVCHTHRWKAGRRRRQIARVWQTWQGYFLRVLAWSSLNINVFWSFTKRSV